MGQHHCGMLLTPWYHGKLKLFWGQKGVQLNSRKEFLFCTLSVYVSCGEYFKLYSTMSIYLDDCALTVIGTLTS
jgi:hypothetical protein